MTLSSVEVLRPWPSRRGRKGLRAGDDGAHTVEFAIVALPLLIVTFMVIQAALVFHARSMALAAATQGAQVARAYGSSLAAGKTKAEGFLDSVGQGLHNPEVEVVTSGTDVTVTVTGNAPSIIPFMTFGVTQSASGPVERFVPS
jgi:Flp pilus assembly protein TadG